MKLDEMSDWDTPDWKYDQERVRKSAGELANEIKTFIRVNEFSLPTNVMLSLRKSLQHLDAFTKTPVR